MAKNRAGFATDNITYHISFLFIKRETKYVCFKYKTFFPVLKCRSLTVVLRHIIVYIYCAIMVSFSLTSNWLVLTCVVRTTIFWLVGNASSAVSTHPLTESTPLSRCAWNDTPAGSHQVFNVLDSTGSSLTPRFHQPGEVNEVIEISDSTEDSLRMDDGNRNHEPKNSQDIESDGYDDVSRHGESRPDEYQSSLTRRNVSEDLQRNSSTTEGEMHTTNIAEHVHRHIHKHVHKHKHRHKHKHKHKRKHKNEHERKRKHSGIREHKRHDVTDVCDGKALSCCSRCFVDVSATQIRPSACEIQTNNVVQVHSPKLEEMRKEIEELNVLIQQHEEQLLSLTRRTEN